jgi:hypothetical protein
MDDENGAELVGIVGAVLGPVDIAVEDVGIIRHRRLVGHQRAFAKGVRGSAAVGYHNLVHHVRLRGRRYQDQSSRSGNHRVHNTYGIPHDSPQIGKRGENVA